MPVRPRVFVLGNFVQACCWFVPRLPSPGETVAATALHMEAGGKGLNVAVGLHRLGAAVDVLIGIGSDVAGGNLLALLQDEGMDAQHVARFDGPSGWGAGFIGADGQNAITVYPGANLALNADHVVRAAEDIARSRLVYGQFETALPAVVQAFELAAAAGVPTVLNPSPWQRPPDAVRATTSVVLVNEVEVCDLMGLTGPLPACQEEVVQLIGRALPAFWATWPAALCLVVTLGALGAVAFERPAMAAGADPNVLPPSYWHAGACSVVAVDTVGAGDAFACGFCTAWLAGLALPECLRWGNACGGLMASRSGVLDHLPRLDTLLAWWADHPVPLATSRQLVLG